MNKHKILIIDDDEFLLEMYSLKFREAGFEVEIAFGGAEALEKIHQGFTPEIILLDLVMPNMDGFDFLKIIKQEEKAANAKIIILSNLGQQEDIEKGLAMGASDYIIKAYFTPSEVIKKIKKSL